MWCFIFVIQFTTTKQGYAFPIRYVNVEAVIDRTSTWQHWSRRGKTKQAFMKQFYKICYHSTFQNYSESCLCNINTINVISRSIVITFHLLMITHFG